jgi:beta-glucanase (GH16 family)
MKRSRWWRSVSGLLTVGALTLAMAPASTAVVVAPPHALRLTWADDFDGPSGRAPDASKWKHDVGGDGWGNQELQHYTSSTRNAALDGGGNLVITAREERPSGSSCWYGTCKYSSARLITQGKFDQAYGRFEARMKLPKGQGMWPAFWMLGADYDTKGWPDCGEIDVMENVGAEPSTSYGTLHGPGYSDENGPGGSTTLPDGAPLSGAFHTYAVDWTAESISWSLDGRGYLTQTRKNIPAGAPWVFDHKFFMLLNLAVGGTWPGSPDSSTRFPQELTVDYVHVFS